MHSYLLYIDPGAGSYLVQVIIAAALGIVFFFKNIVRYISNAWLLTRILLAR